MKNGNEKNIMKMKKYILKEYIKKNIIIQNSGRDVNIKIRK